MNWFIHTLHKPYFYILIILVGSLFKITQIHQGFFWDDEVATIFHVNGQDATNFFETSEKDMIRPSSYYVNQLYLTNRSDNHLGKQLGRLATKPQFTPAHYAFLAIWYRIFGDSPIIYRWFSFFCYVLTLVTLFFLGKELFPVTIGGWVVASLFAVSPFFHFSAITARYYILFLLAFALSHLFLLYALRSGRRERWIAYSLTMIYTLYISFFGLLIMGAHFLFIIWKKSNQWKSFLISSGAVLFAYIPWLWLLWTNYEEMYQAMEWHKLVPLSFLEMVFWQLTHISTILVDLWGETSLGIFFRGFTSSIANQLILTSILTIVPLIYLIYFLIKKGSENVKGLLLPLLVTGSLFLFCIDLYRGSLISAMPHYQTSMMFTVFLILTFFFTDKLNSNSTSFSFLFLLSIGLCMYSISLQRGNRCVSIRGDCPKNLAIARLLEEPGKKLLVTSIAANYKGANVLSVLYESEADQLDVLSISDESDIDSIIPKGEYDHIYVFESKAEIEAALKEKFKDKMVEKFKDFRSTFWEIEWS